MLATVRAGIIIAAASCLVVASAQRSVGSRGRRANAYTPACSDQLRAKIVAASPLANSQCPDTTQWVQFVASLDPEPAPSSRRTRPQSAINIVHVGCNKGDDIIMHMALFSKNASYNMNHVRRRNIENGLDPVLGQRACPSLPSADAFYDKLSVHNKKNTPRSNVFGYCIEPMPQTYDLITKSFADLGLSSHLKTFRYAVSSRPGVVAFPTKFAGVEYIGLGFEGEGVTKVPTDAVTIDLFARDQKLTHIDVLSIDTEGNDARAVIGAVHVLPKTKYMEFEYHNVNHWQQSDLQDLVDLLDGIGFTCYWAGSKGELWPLTNCWDDEYYKKGWSNVACCNRRVDGLCDYMDAHAVK